MVDGHAFVAQHMDIPCCISEPMLNQRELSKLNWFSTTSESGLQGFGLYHSYGVNLRVRQVGKVFDRLKNLGKSKKN